MSVKKKSFICGLMVAGVCLFASVASSASSTAFIATALGGGVYEYLWTVQYDGLNPTGFGQLEVYLPTKMNSATNNVTTLNGANLVPTGGSNAYDDTAGPTVTYPWNASHYDATHVDWTQARIDLETPDQEGFDPNIGEISFLTNGFDTSAGTYQFSYELDQYIPIFFYELHDSREADEGAFQSGNASVPEPTTVLLFGLGLVGLARARRKLKV